MLFTKFLCIRCFPRQWPSRLGIITPFGVIYIFNIIMFVIILVSVLHHGNIKGEKEGKFKRILRRALITFVLAIMFGVGWVFGVLGSSGLPPAISRSCQFTFIFVITFQGLLIFLLHPCRSKDAREEWRRWFYYATCQAKAYSTHLKQTKLSKPQRSGDHSKPKTSSTALPPSISRGPGSSGPLPGGPISSSPGSRGVKSSGGRQAGHSAASAIARRFGYTGGHRVKAGTGKMRNQLTIPGAGKCT